MRFKLDESMLKLRQFGHEMYFSRGFSLINADLIRLPLR